MRWGKLSIPAGCCDDWCWCNGPYFNHPHVSKNLFMGCVTDDTALLYRGGIHWNATDLTGSSAFPVTAKAERTDKRKR